MVWKECVQKARRMLSQLHLVFVNLNHDYVQHVYLNSVQAWLVFTLCCINATRASADLKWPQKYDFVLLCLSKFCSKNKIS